MKAAALRAGRFKNDGTRAHHMGDYIPQEEFQKFMVRSRSSGSGFRAQGSGCRIQGSGCTV